MAVTYTREQRQYAKEHGLRFLATIAVGGMEFQGPVTDEEANELLEAITEFLRRRGARLASAHEHEGGTDLLGVWVAKASGPAS